MVLVFYLCEGQLLFLTRFALNRQGTVAQRLFLLFEDADERFVLVL